RIGIAWDPTSDGKTVVRASYGIFYDHPLLGLFFLGDASDGSKSGQLLFAGGAPCDGAGQPAEPEREQHLSGHSRASQLLTSCGTWLHTQPTAFRSFLLEFPVHKSELYQCRISADLSALRISPSK